MGYDIKVKLADSQLNLVWQKNQKQKKKPQVKIVKQPIPLPPKNP